MTPLADLGPLDYKGPAFLTFFYISYIVLIVLAVVIRGLGKQSRVTPVRTYEPNEYEVAMLSGGGDRAISAAVVTLGARGLIKNIGRKLYAAGAPLMNKGNALEQAVLEAVSGPSLDFGELRRRVCGVLAEMRAGLVEKGLMVEAGRAEAYRMFSLLVALVMPVMGVMKVMVGISRDKPVGFLIVSVLITGGISVAVFLRPLITTWAGYRLLGELIRKTNQTTTVSEATRHVEATNDKPAFLGKLANDGLDPVVMAVGLYGTGFLNGTRLDGLRIAADPRATVQADGSSWGDSNASSCSGGSSCGGGSCGGGGCGGCGGS